MEEIRLEAVLIMNLEGQVLGEADKRAISYVLRVAPGEHSAVISYIIDLSATRA